ncbi:MAG: thiamine pyrophosphate-dependent dehydrogenase E1 component subunit alpha [Alphaproteobacteria bacterium]|nr:thiamine pyrophosphate-dependent dehydrogenase E1 component subunit alpha [Alphaproteobacteria bacterium]
MTLDPEPLPKTTSIQLFKSLFLARRSEEYIVKHYPENLMRTPMHMSMGQEFVSVGVCAALEGKADVFASYRSHAAFLAQTHDTDLFFSELYGRSSGTGEGKGGSMHLASPGQGHILSSGVVATQIPVAVGAGFANMRLGTGRTAVVFFGDGAADAGVFWESLNVAALYRLPVMFVCEDNGYAVDTPREARQVPASLTEAVKAFVCDSYEDDSGDVESVYRLARGAVEKAHRERRPAFLNVKCCRYLEHVGTGDDWHWGYRDKAAVEREWISRDALLQQRVRLASLQMSESAIVAVEDEIDRAIRASVAKASQAPIPGPERLYAGVFHEKA